MTRRPIMSLLVAASLAAACGDAGETVCPGPLCPQADNDAGMDDGSLDEGGTDAGVDTTPDVAPGDTRPPDSDAATDSTEDDGFADAAAPDVFDGFDGTDAGSHLELAAQPVVGLPFSEAGTMPASAPLEVYELGGVGSVSDLAFETSGPFALNGERSALRAGETRILTVTYTGEAAEPALIEGEARIGADGQEVAVELFAVLGDPELPAATWTTDASGTRAVVDLPSAPFPHPSASWTDRSVLVVVPPGMTDTAGVGVVCHLHGFNAIIPERVDQQHLVELHALSGRDAVFVAPQGPYDAASGNFGKLGDRGGFERLLRDVVAVLYRDGFIERPRVGQVVVTSHSGGYQAAADVVTLGGVAVGGLQLYDSVYGRVADFTAFAAGGGGLRSNYTSGGGTVDQNLALIDALENAGLVVGTEFGDADLDAQELIVGYATSTHGDCMWDERTAARWLATSGLRPRPDAPPELLRSEITEAGWVVDWRLDVGAPDARYRVQRSNDGSVWETVAETNGSSALLDPQQDGARVRVVRVVDGYGESDPSDVYGTTGTDWLVVDGFDRVIGGSYGAPTHGFTADLGAALGEGFASASNEAVADGVVDLTDYAAVVWMLGDESTHDLTFDADERAAITAFVSSGGRLIVTGSEVGYATSAAWLSETLHVSYVADDAGTTEAGGYTFGVAYDEDYPDVLAGDEVIWAYATGGAAAVGWNGRIVVVGFPLETLADADRGPALRELVEWLE